MTKPTASSLRECSRRAPPCTRCRGARSASNRTLKREVLAQLQATLTPACVIRSHPSALPVTQLQHGARHPRRILGIHWAEPAHITRFMEVICGDQTAPEVAQTVLKLARKW